MKAQGERTKTDWTISKAQEFNNVNEHYDYRKLCLHETAFEALEFYQGDRGKKRRWWDEEIEEDIKVKHQRYLNSKKLR